MSSRLAAEQLTLAYGEDLVIASLSLEIPDQAITTIVGPNGCGKSTLLKGLARLHSPTGGAAYLDGQEIHRWPTIEVARRLGLLGQRPEAPAGLLVEELVHRGRYPHQSFLQPPTRKDEDAVDRALRLAGLQELRRRPVDRLSGGQRQRAWIAMALAQETPLLLLDEPTTYLDLAHRQEVMDLIARLNLEEGRTVVMVLHDINEAARISDYVVAMKGGRIVREGFPRDVLDVALLTELYDVPCDVHHHAPTGQAVYVPRSGTRPECRSRPPACGLEIQRVRLGYGDDVIVPDLSLTIPGGKITVVVGPNASGKSTLLRACSRLLAPDAGVVQLDGRDVRAGSHKTLARKMALLLQGAPTPAGFQVEDLVAAGRTPHQHLLRQWRPEDEAAVEHALERCQLCEMRDRPLESLSGGQQRRCWFGMALAQETPVMLLDEPTTFLDPAAQIALLDLVRELNRQLGRTIVMVLHDLDLAARYADHLVVLRRGEVVAAGAPREMVTADLIREVFGIEVDVISDPRTGAPLCIPLRPRNGHAESARGSSSHRVVDELSGGETVVNVGEWRRHEQPDLIWHA